MTAGPYSAPERMAYRVSEAADVIAISRSRFYELVAEVKFAFLKKAPGRSCAARNSSAIWTGSRVERRAQNVGPTGSARFQQGALVKAQRG